MTRSNLGNLMIVLMPALATAGGILAFCGIHGVKAGNWILSPGRHRFAGRQSRGGHHRGSRIRFERSRRRPTINLGADRSRQRPYRRQSPGDLRRPAQSRPTNGERRFQIRPPWFRDNHRAWRFVERSPRSPGRPRRETQAAVNALRPLYNPRNLQVGQKVSIRFRPPTGRGNRHGAGQKNLVGLSPS